MEHCISSTCIENVLLTEIIYHFQSTVLAGKLNFLAVGASVTEVICIFVSTEQLSFLTHCISVCSGWMCMHTRCHIGFQLIKRVITVV